MMSSMMRLTYWCNSLKHLSPLVFRLALAYGFFNAGMAKVQDMPSTIQYFQAIGIPLADFMAYFVTLLEILGSGLLLLGLATRIISTLLLFVMFVAIFVAHMPHGQDVTVPATYAMALFSLMTTGAGRWSFDRNCPYEKSICSCSCCGGSKESKNDCNC